MAGRPIASGALVEALAAPRNITAAAAAVGMSVRSAYKLRHHPAAAGFRAAWDTALVQPFTASGPTLLEHAMARKMIVRSGRGFGGSFGGDSGVVAINRPIPAWQWLGLLDRTHAAVVRPQKRAIPSPS